MSVDQHTAWPWKFNHRKNSGRSLTKLSGWVSSTNQGCQFFALLFLMAYSDPLKISSICSCTLNWRAKVLCRFCCRSSNGGQPQQPGILVHSGRSGLTGRLNFSSGHQGGCSGSSSVAGLWPQQPVAKWAIDTHQPTHSPFVCPCKYIAGYWKGTRFYVCSHRASEGFNHCLFFFPFFLETSKNCDWSL